MEKSLEKNQDKKFDLFTDNSIQKYVNPNISFNNKKYHPKNLEKINSDFIIDLKGNSLSLSSEANENLQKLAKDFHNFFGENLKIVSAYRDYNYQLKIKKTGCDDRFCAKAGFSEHQSGLAIDIFEVSDNYSWLNNKKLRLYYSWFKENAHRYGFHNTYQKGLEIDGYEIEPWHWRYLGMDLASYLKENNLTFAQYYEKQKK